MTAATATSRSPILYRSRRRIAIWALALTFGGAVAGTATTLAVTKDDNSATKAVPGAVVTPTQQSRGSNADSSDSYHYKLGPGPH